MRDSVRDAVFPSEWTRERERARAHANLQGAAEITETSLGMAGEMYAGGIYTLLLQCERRNLGFSPPDFAIYT